MKKLTLIFFMLCSVATMQAHKTFEKFIHNPVIDLTTDFPENIDFVWTLQNYYAVDLFGGKLTESELDSIINSIKAELAAIPSQKITLTELVHLYWTKLLHKAAQADSHFHLIIPRYLVREGVEFNSGEINVLPFAIRLINNRAVVCTSTDEQFKRGDIIISINGTPIENYLEHFASLHTHIRGGELQPFYHFSYAKTYDVKIERHGEFIAILSQGRAMSVPYSPEPQKPKSIVFKEHNAGYFNIIDFFSDGIETRAEEMALFVDSLQQLGINNLIIDIRNNPGGNDEYMIDFFSIMTDKTALLGYESAVMRVSEPFIEMLRQFSFPEELIEKFDLENNIGQIINLFDIFGTDTGELDNTKYRKGMNYYILMGEQTKSTAAGFARVAQMNNIATLAGLPTLPNPDVMGNVLRVEWNGSPYLSVFMSSSKFTFEGEDFTVDGRIMPDIKITYTIEEFATREDPQLEKLLEIIRNKN